MKTLFKLILISILSFSTMALSRCSKELIETPSLVIIAGIHSNSQKINYPVEQMVQTIYSQFGDVGIIVADGTPSLVYDQDGSILGSYNEAFDSQAQQLKRDNEDYWFDHYLSVQVSALISNISLLEPDSCEVDTLAAIQEAAKVINGSFSANTGSKEIIIFDTGLSTAGALNFLETDWLNIIFSEERISKKTIDSMLNNLFEQNEIPQLNGIQVTWYGLGAVANPQPKLSNLNISNLQNLWGEILKRTNAIPSKKEGAESAYGFFVSVPTSQEILEYEQTVTPVINWDSVGTINANCDNETSNGIVLSEEKLGFKPDSSEFESYDYTKRILSPYAANLLKNPTLKILLIGTTADPNHNGGSLDLSEKRAKKVKDCFLELGVPSNQIDILAWGAREPFYDEKEWISGSFDSNYAKTNRSVILLPYDSPLAQSIIK